MSDTSERVLRSRSRGRSLLKEKFKDGMKSSSITTITGSSSKTLVPEELSIEYTSKVNGNARNHNDKTADNVVSSSSSYYNEFNSGGKYENFGGSCSSSDEENPWLNGTFKSAEESAKFYNNYEDWWNHFPKTDITYSRDSKWFGKQIAPGIPFIPNMSRPPLHNDAAPEYIKKLLAKFKESSSRTENSTASSDAFIKRVFIKIFTTITTIFTTVWTSVTTSISYTFSGSSDDSCTDSSDAVTAAVNSWWRAPFRWLYKFSTWLFVQECWLLENMNSSKMRSQHDEQEREDRKKKSIWKFLFLLFLLLLGLLGWRYYHELSDSVTSYITSPDYISPTDTFRNALNVVYRNASYGFRLLQNASNFVWNAFTAMFLLMGNSIVYSYETLQGSFLYLCGMLPVVSQYCSASGSTYVPDVTADKQQLVALVQQTVRETLKKDSALLLGDTVNHPRFKVLMEKALAEKTGSWDPTALFASNQWKVAVKEIVEEYYSDSGNKDGLEENIKIIENKVDQTASDVSMLNEGLNKLNEKLLILERDVNSIFQQFVSHQHLEEVIKNLTIHFNYQFKIDEEHMMEKILSDVSMKVKEDITNLFKTLHENKQQVEFTAGNVDFNQVKAYVSQSIERALALYDADKTGMVDYALESGGGIVVSTRCTESFTTGQKAYLLFGFTLWHRSNSPRTVIQPSVQPGECWAFAGGQGYLVIQLSKTIVVTAFTLEHIPRSLAPEGRIDSAPKDFSVWGLKFEADSEPSFLGRFRFMENGTSLQKFEALSVEEPFGLVELKIETNHGNLEYTCLYRFRVHGVPVS